MSSDDFLALLVFGPLLALCVIFLVDWWRS